MPAWTAITLDEIRAEAAVARVEAAFSTDQGDIEAHFGRIRTNIVAEIRSKIGANPANAIDSATDTVPPEWVGYAALRILARMLARAGMDGEGAPYKLTEDQRKELDRRENDLDLVAEGKLPVSLPTTAATAPEVGSTAPNLIMGGRTREFSRDGMDGL
jgi:hypothetical protein